MWRTSRHYVAHVRTGDGPRLGAQGAPWVRRAAEFWYTQETDIYILSSPTYYRPPKGPLFNVD
jgi:hypothetical protein